MRILQILKRQARDERGSLSVEAVLMFPMLAWAFMAMFVFFEGLRESNINLKATYTVSDLLAREQDPNNLFGEDDLEGMHAIYAWLSRSKHEVRLRVSFVTFDEGNPQTDNDDSHDLRWSRGVHGVPNLLQGDVASVLSPHIPILADGAGVIVVETWALYDPVIDMGLTDTELYNIVVTPPRFAGQLVLEGVGDGGGSEHDDGTSEDVEL